jgi:hypothetical protein
MKDRTPQASPVTLQQQASQARLKRGAEYVNLMSKSLWWFSLVAALTTWMGSCFSAKSSLRG